MCRLFWGRYTTPGAGSGITGGLDGTKMLVLLLLGSVHLGGCETDPNPAEISPTPANRHPQDETGSYDFVLNQSSSDVSGGLDVVARALQTLQPVVSIGTLNGRPETVWGSITSAAFAADGDLLVLDAQANEVRRFAADGSFRKSFGRRGEGPVEMRDPVSIDIVGADSLAVTTRSGVMLIDVSGTARQIRTMKLGAFPSPRDACALDERLLVHGWHRTSETTLHALALDSTESVTSFGTGYQLGGAIVRQKLSTGRIACVPALSAVVLGHENRSVLIAYTATGDTVWTTRITDFVPAAIVEDLDEGGRTRVTEHTSAAHDMVAGLTTLADRLVLVQVVHLEPPATPEAGQPITELRSWLIDVSGRRGTYIGGNVPFILAARNGLLAGIPFTRNEDDMVPRIVLYSFPDLRP